MTWIRLGFVVLSSVGAHHRAQRMAPTDGRSSKPDQFKYTRQTPRLCCSDSQGALCSSCHPTEPRTYPLIPPKTLQRRPASIIESAGAEASDLSLSSLLLQVQSDRASCLPARDPSLQGRPARNHRDRQALHRKNRNDQGAQGSCPNARQGVSDRTQIRQGLQAKHDHQIRRIPAKMELHRHPRWPLKSGIYFGTVP